MVARSIHPRKRCNQFYVRRLGKILIDLSKVAHQGMLLTHGNAVVPIPSIASVVRSKIPL